VYIPIYVFVYIREIWSVLHSFYLSSHTATGAHTHSIALADRARLYLRAHIHIHTLPLTHKYTHTNTQVPDENVAGAIVLDVHNDTISVVSSLAQGVYVCVVRE